MIENERQYQITKAQAAKFEQAVDQLITQPDRTIHPRIREAQRVSLESMLYELREQLQEYERLK